MRSPSSTPLRRSCIATASTCRSRGCNRATTRPGPADRVPTTSIARSRGSNTTRLSMPCSPATKSPFTIGKRPYFDGCLPIEVMAERGRETLRHGPMKPFGLTNPHAPAAQSLCGRAAAPGQPARHPVQHGGLPDQAETRRAGAHLPHDPGHWRAPSSRAWAGFTATPFSTRRSCLTGRLRLKAEPRLRFAGQITGCEGYVESAAIGLLAGRFAAAERLSQCRDAATADDGAWRTARRISPAGTWSHASTPAARAPTSR